MLQADSFEISRSRPEEVLIQLAHPQKPESNPLNFLDSALPRSDGSGIAQGFPKSSPARCFSSFIMLLAGLCCASFACAQGLGTPERPFAANSPWNIRPVNAVLGDPAIPRSSYLPSVAEGRWSTGVFVARETDTAVDVLPLNGKPGVWDPDAEIHRPLVRIQRWPASVIPATGLDGHAEIVDPVAGIIHSFFQLSRQDGQWRAGQYAWTKLGGRGWGDPAHYFQGSRAAGVPTIGGLIRKHEILDGLPHYRHALAMSLTFNGLAAEPPYLFPATSADSGARDNTGTVPEGSLMMLPPDFDTARIANVHLRKVADTLKLFGAYVVDRNHGTPFAIYVENGSNFNLHPKGWDNAVATELDRIRAELRPVLKSVGWVDANGQSLTIERNLNLLSLRGPWRKLQGNQVAEYQTLEQAVVFPPTTESIVMVNWSGRNLSQVTWARAEAGKDYLLKVNSVGDAKLRLQLQAVDGTITLDTGAIEGGQSFRITWPALPVKVILLAYSGTSGKASRVGASLLALSPSGTAGQ
jgi:hypothetical protein